MPRRLDNSFSIGLARASNLLAATLGTNWTLSDLGASLLELDFLLELEHAVTPTVSNKAKHAIRNFLILVICFLYS